MNWHGKPVTVMGLGHFGGGVAAARWLAGQGARVTVTDLADQKVLADSLAELTEVPIAAFHLGGHQEDDFRNADAVVVNPAVRPGNPYVEIARNAGARITTEIEMFIRECPARIVGVTGSNGKSTTAAMTAAILCAAGRCTWLGGNLGGSLLERLGEIGPEDWVVLELSSFQLWYMDPRTPMPHVAVVTNCTSNHLDWHGRFEDYAAAKQRILTGQTPEDFAVLNTLDPEVAAWSRLVRGRQVPLLPEAKIPPLPVAGEHNRINAACAAVAAAAAGCDEEAIRQGLEGFTALPQRLELVAVVGGRRFYNDSSATAPESTVAALNSLEGRVWLLAGGRDKGLDFRSLCETMVGRACGAAFYGSVRDVLLTAVTDRSPGFCAAGFQSMAGALAWCWEHSRPGDAIVLSPACSSQDQFQNFRQRGEHFAALVRRLAEVDKTSPRPPE